jgi:sigma-B regulation protein RsbU (phosphoserine phosphatase)
LQKTGPIAGLSRDARYENTSIGLQPGDKLFMYTDGLIEAKDSFGNMWGVRSLVKRILRIADRDAETIGSRIFDMALHHVAGNDLDDDLTIVVAQIDENWEPVWETLSTEAG